MSRPTRTERRRAQLALRIASLEAMESRSLITESLGILTAGIGVPTALAMARPTEAGPAVAANPRPSVMDQAITPVVIVPASAKSPGGGSAAPASPITADLNPVPAASTLPLAVPAANTITVKWASPASPAKGGGAGGSSHGGSGAVSAPSAVTSSPSVASSSPSGTSSAGSSGSAPILPVSTAPGSPSGAVAGASSPSAPGIVPVNSPSSGGRASNPVVAFPGTSGATGGAQALLAFANFPLYVLDQNAGQVILPGADKLATLGGNMDLRAQVSGTTVSSYSWDTSGLTNATSIAGASTYDLTFQWSSSVATATTNSTTLTVTNTSGQTQVETFTFLVPAGTGTAGTGTATWPTSLSPDTEIASAPSFAAHNVSVDANSGSLGTAISLPTYNPNVPAVVLSYDSVSANPLPIITVPHTLNPSLATPTQVSGQLTFNGTSGSTYYYNTSQFIPGDVQQVALQANAASLATGRYAYTATLGDIRGTTTTTTVSGSTTVINDSGSAIGSGWVVAGQERIIPVTGGVVLDLGSGGQSLFFATGSGSTYLDPAGEFSTLVANTGGTYTRTLTDGTTIQFDGTGREVADVDTNGVAITYGYDGSGRLSTIQDHYGNTTTFTYDGTTGLLDEITDPAGRVATFTHSGTGLSGVTLPDSSTWGYAYNGSSGLTQVTDPNGKVVSVVYDAANRVGTITNPDATSETFLAAQEQGFVPSGSGTSGSPATATLLAQATSNFTDPLGNQTNLYPDWQGLGLTDVKSDPLGEISTWDRNGNGLATIALDNLNRVSQAVYDSKGNVTHTVNADGTTASATYNSLAEPLTQTNALNETVTYTYDSRGNKTNTDQPLGVNATMTYSGTGQVTSDSNPAGDASLMFSSGQPSAGGGPISYTYDSQDRMTGQVDALGEATSYTYDSAGDRTATTDPNGHTTTATYDALGRILTTTDALGDTTTHVYDAAGNPTVVIDPLGHRTTTAYDVMNRVHTVSDARGGITTYAYDADGREISITDSVGNATTYAYDQDGRQTGSTNPNGYASTQSYNADGQVIETIDANGRQINYGYDSMGREVTESWISGTVTLETITMTYDAAGQETAITDGTTALTFAYDQDGRQTGEATSGTSGQPAVALTIGYYDSNARESLTDNLSSVGITSYGYDSAFRLASVANDYSSSQQEIDLGYDATGNLTSLTRKTGGGLFLGGGTTVVTSYTYDAADRITGIVDLPEVYGSPGSTIDSQSYGYNANGEVTSETNAEGTVSYTYDNINELTGVSGASTATYSYDANGNRTMTGYSTGTGNETTAGAGYTYTYDQDGNLTSKTQTSTGDVWTYTWDYRNRLTGVVEQNSSHTLLMRGTYTYDPMNRRIGVDETVSGTETKTYTVYDGVNPYADFDGSGNLQERYLYGPGSNQVLARTSGSGTIDWYLADHLGSVRDIVDTSGTTIDHLGYDAYGNVTSETSSSNGDRFKFDGMVWDTAIGIYYDNARYYDATSGRFLSQDPTSFGGSDMNLTRFTHDDPVNRLDLDGKHDHGGNGGWLRIDPNFESPNYPDGVAITYIPEDYEKYLPLLPMQRPLPKSGKTFTADAVLLPGIGMFKLRNGGGATLRNDPKSGLPIIVEDQPAYRYIGPIPIAIWGTWYSVGSPNPFFTDIPGGPDDEGDISRKNATPSAKWEASPTRPENRVY